MTIPFSETSARAMSRSAPRAGESGERNSMMMGRQLRFRSLWRLIRASPARMSDDQIPAQASPASSSRRLRCR